MSSIIISVYSEAVSVADFRKHWNKLVNNSKFNLHNYFDWVYNYQEYVFKNWKNVLLLKVARNDEVLGFVPLRIEKYRYRKIFTIKKLVFWGAGPSDWNSFIGDALAEPEVIREIIHYIQKHYAWHEIQLDNLTEEDTFLETFKNILNPKTYSVNINSRCFFIPTTGSWEEYIEKVAHKKFVRQDIKRIENRLLANNINWEIKEITDGIDTILNIVHPLHAQSQQRRGRQSFFENPDQRKFYTIALRFYSQQGKLKLFLLQFNDETAAYILSFYHAKVLFYWNIGFNTEFERYSPSKFLLYQVVKQCFDTECTELNFMRGETAYKLRWAKEFTTNYQLKIYNQTGITGIVNRLRRIT